MSWRRGRRSSVADIYRHEVCLPINGDDRQHGLYRRALRQGCGFESLLGTVERCACLLVCLPVELKLGMRAQQVMQVITRLRVDGQ